MQTKQLCLLIYIRRRCETSLSPPLILFLTIPMRCFFRGSFLCLSLPSVMSVYCSLVVTCWERADLLAALLC